MWKTIKQFFTVSFKGLTIMSTTAARGLHTIDSYASLYHEEALRQREKLRKELQAKSNATIEKSVASELKAFETKFGL